VTTSEGIRLTRDSKASRATARPTEAVYSVPPYVGLRHEVARVIVWHIVRTRPAVPSAVSYEDVREGNDPYRAFGHGTHSHPTGTRTVRGRCICPPQAERGPDGWDGAHTCTLDTRRERQQAKEADRLEPTGHWSTVQGLSAALAGTGSAPGEESAPHPFVSPLRNVVSPSRSCLEGRKAARPTDGGAGMGVGTSAGRLVMGRLRVATFPDAPAG